MKSRYDFMSEGVTADTNQDSLYPDPLSLNYLGFNMSSLPSKRVLNNSDICFFWRLAEDEYDDPQWDDMVLTLNGVSHRNFLRPQDEVYFPQESDFYDSFQKGSV